MRKLFLLILILPVFLSASEVLEKIRSQRVVDDFRQRSERLLFELKQIAPYFQIGESQIVIEKLENALKKSTIETSRDELIDNSGSLVDIIGIPGKIIINEKSWLNFTKKKIDIRMLIIHEILRAVGINDDNYLISRELYGQLPILIDNLNPPRRPYCNLHLRKTVIIQKRKKIRAKGISSILGNIQEARNAAFANAEEKCRKKKYDSFQYWSGTNKMYRTFYNGVTKAASEVLIWGVCLKNIIKKRSKRKIRKEMCQKISLCRDIYDSSLNNSVTYDDFNMLDNLIKEYRCK